MTAQTGILPLPTPHARYLVFNCRELDREALKTALQTFVVSRRRLQTQDPEAGLATTVAFGPSFWQSLQGRSPAGFHALQPLEGAFSMPATEGDVLVHVHSQRADLCFALVQELMATLGQRVEVLEDVTGFRYFDSRDLTGFIDGTENPQLPEARAEAALVAEGEYADGSFVFAQRYVHHLDKWHRLTVDTQEKVIGRTKLESIELDDEAKPDNAHIARVVIEENGDELEILRQSLPYGSASGEQGLFFVAYTRDVSIIDRMLASMFGTTGDGQSDRLLNFVTPVGGAYFFAPSEELWREVIGEA